MSGTEIIRVSVAAIRLLQAEAEAHFDATEKFTEAQYWRGQMDAYTDAIAALQSLASAAEYLPR